MGPAPLGADPRLATAGGAPSGPADPLAQRLRQLAGVLAVLLILVVVNALLNGGNEELSLNPIAVAAERTQQAPGARMAVEAIYTVPGLDTELVATGSGAYNARSGRTSTTLALPVPGRGEVTVEAVGNARTFYMRSDLFAGELPPGKEWISVDPWLGNGEAASMAGSADAKGGLEMLEAVGEDYDSLGEETVGGVLTSRYRSEVELEDYADELRSEGKTEAAELYERMAEEMPGPVTSEVWIDDANLIRRMRMVTEVPQDGGEQEVTMDMRIEFTHLDSAPPIALPPPGKVLDATPIARAELGITGGAGGGSAPSEPADASPEPDGAPSGARTEPAGGRLSPLGFRRSANRICGQMRAKGERIVAGAEADAARFEKRLAELKRQGPEALNRGLRRYLAGYAERYMEPIYALGKEMLNQMGQLSPPAAAEGRFKRLLQISELEIELVLAQTRAMQLFDKSAFDSLDKRQDGLGERSDRIAGQLDLHACVSDDEADEDAGSGSLPS